MVNLQGVKCIQFSFEFLRIPQHVFCALFYIKKNLALFLKTQK